NGNPLPVEPSTTTGTYSFNASQPATYRLVATNRAGGTAEVVRALTIGPPQIPVFTASRSILTAGDVLELNWETRGGNQLDILENGSVMHTETTAEGIASGSLLVPPRPMDDYVYTLRLQNGLGTTVERQVQVLRTNGPVIESFTLEEDLVCVGEEPVVSWSVTRDAFDVPPNVRVEVAGVSVPLSGAEGSAPLPPLPPGLHALTLIAETPGTRPHSAVLTIEVIDEIVFDRVEVSPPEPEAGTNVTVTSRRRRLRGRGVSRRFRLPLRREHRDHAPRLPEWRGHAAPHVHGTHLGPLLPLPRHVLLGDLRRLLGGPLGGVLLHAHRSRLQARGHGSEAEPDHRVDRADEPLLERHPGGPPPVPARSPRGRAFRVPLRQHGQPGRRLGAGFCRHRGVSEPRGNDRADARQPFGSAGRDVEPELALRLRAAAAGRLAHLPDR